MALISVRAGACFTLRFKELMSCLSIISLWYALHDRKSVIDFRFRHQHRFIGSASEQALHYGWMLTDCEIVDSRFGWVGLPGSWVCDGGRMFKHKYLSFDMRKQSFEFQKSNKISGQFYLALRLNLSTSALWIRKWQSWNMHDWDLHLTRQHQCIRCWAALQCMECALSSIRYRIC